MPHTKRYAVILSSGIGKRTGFVLPKQLVKIRGTELLLRSIAIFNNKNSMVNFDKIIITVPPSSAFDFDWKKFISDNVSWQNVNSEFNRLQTDNVTYQKGSEYLIDPQYQALFDKIVIIEGGDLRQKSVYNALNYIEKNFICSNAGDLVPDSDFNSNTNLYIDSKSDPDSASYSYYNSDSATHSSSDSIVFIHDSARPFVTNSEIYMLNEAASKFGASFLFGLVTDTIKSAECRKDNKDYLAEKNSGHKSLELKYFNTLDRNNLIAAKTPQVFKFNIIKKAMDKIFKKNVETNLEKFTDDISFIENCGIPAKPILSNDYNIKITSASDVDLAEFFLDRFDKINRK